MSVTMPAPVTETITIPTDLPAPEAIARLRASEEAVRANPHWLVPTTLAVDWAETSGAISGVAFGFAVDGTIAATGDAVTVSLTVPWTAKALLANFGPRLEASLHSVLA
ncbi:MAG: hypothetical protein ACTHQE_10595 [Thermomicrobiales bacterium]